VAGRHRWRLARTGQQQFLHIRAQQTSEGVGSEIALNVKREAADHKFLIRRKPEIFLFAAELPMT
jgi:hypothetical protein